MFHRKGISALRPNASTSKSYEAMAVVSENKALRGLTIVLKKPRSEAPLNIELFGIT
jgi:hypothetical protein